jgi:hypothetical protein
MMRPVAVTKESQISMYLARMKRKLRSMSCHPPPAAEADPVYERYDKLAFRYVSYVAIPALAIHAVYSLLYETHRGWYSFVISTLTSFVYMFGFVRAKGDPLGPVDLTGGIDCRLS